MERLQVDLCGPYVAADGYTYVCTEICSFTQFVIAWPIGSKIRCHVARGLVDRAFWPFGTPRLLLTEPLNPIRTCPGHHLSTKIGRWRVLSGLVPGAPGVFRWIIVLIPCFCACTEDLGDVEDEAAHRDSDQGPFRIACPAPGCAFRSESRGRLANARRAVRDMLSVSTVRPSSSTCLTVGWNTCRRTSCRPAWRRSSAAK